MAHGKGIGSPAVSQRWEETVAWAVWLMAPDRNTFLAALHVNCCTLDLKPTYGEWPSDAGASPFISLPCSSFPPSMLVQAVANIHLFFFASPCFGSARVWRVKTGITQCNSTPCVVERVKWMIQWPLLAWKSLRTKFIIVMLMQTFCRCLFQHMECLWFILFGVPEYFSSQTKHWQPCLLIYQHLIQF